jgi:hypothetical protein
MVDKKIINEDEGCALYIPGPGDRVLASFVAFTMMLIFSFSLKKDKRKVVR